jgi:hypothetical protein
VFSPTPPSIAVTGRSPNPGAVGVSREVTPSLTLSAPVADGYAMTLRQGSTVVPATVARSGDGTTLTLTPSGMLPGDADFTVEVTGVVSTEGAVLPPQSWTFRTEAPEPTGTTLFGDQTPAVPDVNDNASVELGTVVTPAVDGAITRIRFYKGAGNTGTHVGSVWSAAGVRLGQVTFTNETATGWQVATLPTPVPVTAGQSYVVSYLAPRGHYSSTPSFFTAAWTAGPLTSPAGPNGRYRYGAAGGFPTGSYRSTNYFVDLVFRPAS